MGMEEKITAAIPLIFDITTLRELTIWVILGAELLDNHTEAAKAYIAKHGTEASDADLKSMSERAKHFAAHAHRMVHEFEEFIAQVERELIPKDKLN